MNMTFKIDIDRKKIEAIRCYLPDGNVEQLLHEEITKAANSAVDKLYNRNVPKKVFGAKGCQKKERRYAR